MPLFVSRKQFIKEIQASTIKEIQASLEGNISNVELESLLTGERFTSSVPGTENFYKTYESQVRETYSKYNGRSDFGVAQTRAVVDLRTAMIAGEGVSISTEDDKLAEWINKVLTDNKLLLGDELANSIKGTEMSGQSILNVKIIDPKEDEKRKVKINRLGYNPLAPFRVKYAGGHFSNTDIVRVEIKDGKLWTTVDIKDYVYVRTGGDDLNTYEPTTKVGVVLTDIENYDRAIKDMRRNNHIMARITPTFEVAKESDAKSLRVKLSRAKWKIGQAFIGNAKFKYETPGQGAHENLQTEMTATIKNISGTTGVPVHWLGHVDLMSNRSTAESLYELIKQHTVVERTTWESAIYNLILKAQELYIDTGGEDIKLNTDFQVKLPLLDYSGFLERVKALNIARADGAISMDDYMNMLQGIDPYKTKKAIEKEDKDEGMTLLNQSKEFNRTKDDLSSEED